MLLFITGATGFLGGAAAAEAIRSVGGGRLRLLVRAPSHAEGLARLQNNLKGYGVSAGELASLSEDQIVVGDLLDGIAESEADRLADVTHCIHSAALATFSNNPLVVPVNVQGSINLATYLMTHALDLRRFVYVGTGMACGAQIDDAHVAEQDTLDAGAEHLVPYTASKATAERALRALLSAKTLVVARPSIIVGDTVHGCTNSQSIFWVFLMAQALGCFTVELEEKIDVIPVDYAARALVFLAMKPDLGFSAYHVSAGDSRSNSFAEIDVALATARGIAPVGAAYRKVGHDDLAALIPAARRLFPDVKDRLILRAIKVYGGFASLNYTFGNSRLAAEGFAPPPFFTDYLRRCVETAAHIPLSQQMKWDFK